MSTLNRILATELTPKRPRLKDGDWVQVPTNFLSGRDDVDEFYITYFLLKSGLPEFYYKLVLSDKSSATNTFTNDRQGWHNVVKARLQLSASDDKDFNKWVMKKFPNAELRKK